MSARILVVDDEEIVLRSCLRILSGDEFQVETVQDGRQALQKVEENLYDVMILDIMMPNVDGLEVLRRVKAEPRTRTLPVVILTVSRHDEDIIECGRLGAENYIIKPLSFDGLCRVTPRLNLRWALL